MKKAFMIILFIFVVVILVTFLLKYNQYKNELDKDISGETQIQNEEVIGEFNDEHIEESDLNDKLNKDNISGDETNILSDESMSGEAELSGGEMIDNHISGEMAMISGEGIVVYRSDEIGD